MLTEGLFIVASVLSAIFAASLWRRYVRRRARFYWWWTLSFVFYALTFATEAVTVRHGYHTVTYDFYILGSAGLVGWMSVGTAYLALKSGIARRYASLITVLFLATLGSLGFFPPHIQGDWTALNAGRGITGMTQIFYIILVSLGGTIVFVGAIWSWWKTRRFYNLLIALGVVISSMAGTFASQGLGTVAFPFANLVAVIIIFLGYIYSRPSGGPKAPSKSHDTAAPLA